MYLCVGRCPGEQVFLGDGTTPFSLEARCTKFTSAPSHLCKGHRDSLENGRIDELIPETSRIFGPTAWFLETLKRCGAPSKEVFKKAVEAHKQVVASMAGKKRSTATSQKQQQQEQQEQQEQQQQPSLSFIELDECIEVKEIRTVTLKPIESAKKQMLKDEIHGHLFNTCDGKLTLSPPSLSPAKATTQERAAVEVH